MKHYDGFKKEDMEKYRLCVSIAGLLHDIGHCILGHCYSRYVEECGKPKPIEHEEMGVIIIKRILERDSMNRAFLNRGIGENV